MRSRGAFLTVVLVVGLVAGGGWLLEHKAGLRPARALEGSGSVGGRDDAPSGAWYCPHGGGKGWTGALSISNPGDTDVSIRIRTMTRHGDHPAQEATVPAHSRLSVEVPASTREASTEVEYFGGWVAAGWVTTAPERPASPGSGGAAPSPAPTPSPGPSASPGTPGGESGSPEEPAVEAGVAAESCAGAAGRTWYLADGSTVQGQEDYVVVMNPFGSEASFHLALLAEAREVDGGEITVPGGQSRAIHVNLKALGEQTVAAVVTSDIGRVVAASLGIADSGGIRSAIGVPTPIADPVVPGAGDAGGTEIPFLNPAKVGVSYGVDFLNDKGRSLALPPGQRVGPNATRTETLTATGPGAVSIVPDGDWELVADRRTLGIRGDQGSTPALAPAPAWLLSSPAAGPFDAAQVALANTGPDPVTVTLTGLTPTGLAPGPPASVTIPPDSSIQAPVPFLAGHAQASVVAVSDGGSFVAVMTATARQGAGYAAAAGVPIPPQWIPRD
jgi:hypothetical protein